MKLKEFGPKGHIPGTPLDPLIVVHENYQPRLLFFTKTITIKQTTAQERTQTLHKH